LYETQDQGQQVQGSSHQSLVVYISKVRFGHKSKDCSKKYGRVINALNIHNKDDFRKQQEKIGKCPVCHITMKTGYYWPSHRLSMCDKFTELSTEEKAKKIESVGGCALCISFQHNVIRNKG
jgi:hypothetical protein